MNPLITKRLSRDTNYKPTQESYQSKLDDTQIAKYLEDYVRVKSDNVQKIPLGTHIRYFSINPKSGEKQFRMGGMVTKFGENGQYLVCSNETFSWSVQLSNSIIYKKLSQNELKEAIKKEVVNDSKKDISDLEKENKKLREMLKEIKETTLNSKNKKK
jgi:hypothetical protein